MPIAINLNENDDENTYLNSGVNNPGINADYGRNSASANSSASAEINRLSSELNCRISREMDEMMNSVSVQIQRAINDAISRESIPFRFFPRTEILKINFRRVLGTTLFETIQLPYFEKAHKFVF